MCVCVYSTLASPCHYCYSQRYRLLRFFFLFQKKKNRSLDCCVRVRCSRVWLALLVCRCGVAFPLFSPSPPPPVFGLRSFVTSLRARLPLSVWGHAQTFGRSIGGAWVYPPFSPFHPPHTPRCPGASDIICVATRTHGLFFSVSPSSYSDGSGCGTLAKRCWSPRKARRARACTNTRGHTHTHTHTQSDGLGVRH